MALTIEQIIAISYPRFKLFEESPYINRERWRDTWVKELEKQGVLMKVPLEYVKNEWPDND